MKIVLLVVLFILTLPAAATLQDLDDFAKEMLKKERRELEVWGKGRGDPEPERAWQRAEQTAKANQSAEPVGFGTIEWASPPEALESVFNAYETKNHGRERAFRAGYSIGDAPVTVDFSYVDNKLARIFIWFERRYLDVVSEAFIEKYGKPSRRSGDIMAWSWKKVTALIVGNNPTGNALTSSASLTTAEYSQYLEQRAKYKAAAAAKDL